MLSRSFKLPFQIITIVIFTLVPTHGRAQQNAAMQQQVKHIAGAVLSGSSLDLLKELCERFGPRLTGSKNYQSAAEWAADQFRASGIKNVKFESFTIPNGWQRGWSQGQMYSPVEKRLHIEPVGWSPSTPAGGLQAELILLSDISETAIRSRAGTLRKRIVFLDSDQILSDGFKKNYAKLVASYAIFKEVGVAALLVPDSVMNNVPGDWVDTDNGKAQVLPLPVAELGLEDSKFVQSLLEQGPVTIGFEYQNQITGPVQVNNVVAEIRGSEDPDNWILVGAHLDSWDLATGAQDNGTGSVMVLEAAKAIASLQRAPRRSVRFALWTGEEPGLLGSKAYVKAHIGELDHCVAVINSDNGAGHPLGWKVEGRQDLMDAMKPIAATYLKNFSGEGLSLKINVDTDHAPFMLQGIPALDLWVDNSHYEDVAHKPADTFDKVDPVNFNADAALFAITAYLVAEMPQAIAPHIDHTSVGEIMKKAGLDGYLIAHGDWKP